jgi:hypothetical protein
MSEHIARRTLLMRLVALGLRMPTVLLSALDGAYKRFLEMPVPIVLAVLWVAGAALLGSCVLMLYMLLTSLASVVMGA